jgi:phospholipid transport system substrate-binding protein
MSSKQVFFILLFIFNSNSSILAKDVSENNPRDIIQIATSQMIQELSNQKDIIAEKPTIVMGIVDRNLLTLFASNTISRKVLGKHSRKMSKVHKEQFSAEFRLYMVRFYAKIFSAFNDHTFTFRDPPDVMGKKKVTIKTLLIQPAGKPISVDYKMQRSGPTWKIIDLKIEGISMVISNRTQFGNQISRDGIDTVIAKLSYKNKKAFANE